MTRIADALQITICICATVCFADDVIDFFECSDEAFHLAWLTQCKITLDDSLAGLLPFPSVATLGGGLACCSVCALPFLFWLVAFRPMNRW